MKPRAAFDRIGRGDAPGRRIWLQQAGASGIGLLAALGGLSGVNAAHARRSTASQDDALEPDRTPGAAPQKPYIAPPIDRYQPVPVAPGVYLLRGLKGEVSEQTLGRTGNAAFIVGRSGVIAVNSGTSARDGAQILAAIRHTTALPVRALLLTHALQEFIFGATAFQDQGIPVLMHEGATRLMAARCETCLKTLNRLLGDAEMAGTRVPRADRTFNATSAQDAAANMLPDIGRALRLVTPPGAAGSATAVLSASPGETGLFDETSGTLVVGALLDAFTIPDVQDADLPAWHAALARLRSLPIRRIVPGHGPAAGAALVDTVERYLTQLEQRGAKLLRDGVSLSEVADQSALSEFADWDRYDTTHRRNASIVYLRQERTLMLQDTTLPTTLPPADPDAADSQTR